MNINDHHEMSVRRVSLEEIEEMVCDGCDEKVIFHLRDKDHEFTMGLSTVIECLMFAVEQGDVPKLPLSWCSDVDYVYGTGYSEETKYYYEDSSNERKVD
ncbi:MAG: hypothetical protein IK093_00740 [Ruminiclostridium sp.]|nr:hypothetical protein [Ruminiclostridium sp.]